MSGKRAKRERKMIREVIQFLEPIEPILEEAASEIESAELFEQWSKIAVILKRLKPEIPLEDLLPDNLDRTLDRHKDFLIAMSDSN